MRTIIKKSVLVTFMLIALISYAKVNTTPTKSIVGKRVKVEFESAKIGQTLTIKNENGVTIYSREIQSNGTFSKIFDLSALENGNYRAELNKDFEILVKVFNVKDGFVTFLTEESEKVFKPLIRKEGNLILISKIALNEQPLDVVLYYKSDVILTETLKGKDVLNRIYKLSESQNGDYKIVIKTDNRFYVKDFTI